MGDKGTRKRIRKEEEEDQKSRTMTTFEPGALETKPYIISGGDRKKTDAGQVGDGKKISENSKISGIKEQLKIRKTLELPRYKKPAIMVKLLGEEGGFGNTSSKH